MILTGRAKEDFIDYLWQSKFNKDDYKEYEDYIENQKEYHTYADIIEWFDSVGYLIGIEPYIGGGGGVDVYYAKIVYRMDNFIDTWLDVENTMYSPIELHFNTRQEATKESIIKANQIYNESKN